MFALGMTTLSATDSKQKHVQVMEQAIAAIDNQLERPGISPSIHETGPQQSIGQLKQKASQRNIRFEARTMEYKPSRKNPEIAQSRKSTTTVHNGQKPAASKLGLLQGLNTFRLKDRKPRRENRCLKAKPVTPRNVVVSSTNPKALFHETPQPKAGLSNLPHQKHPVVIVPPPCHPPFTGEMQPRPPHMLQVQYDRSREPEVGWDMGFLPDLSRGQADYFSQRYSPNSPVRSGGSRTIGPFNQDPSNLRYTDLLESDNFDWDQITMVPDSSDPTIPSFQNHSIPIVSDSKLAGFTNTTTLSRMTIG
jgi:hypothetical protein